MRSQWSHSVHLISRYSLPKPYHIIGPIVPVRGIDRGRSSDGRALAEHERGTGIETPQLQLLSFRKKSPGRLHTWKNDRKSGGGAYCHQCSCRVGNHGPDFIFMDDNARPHRTLAVEKLLGSDDITRMDWPAYSPDLNLIEHMWDALGRHIATRLHHLENTQ
ncbi:transposable element Tcb2 transposase [Trichonephila clavipes]|nr:transposable element Tcb2 transposase [Trichonephila clavipes]